MEMLLVAIAVALGGIRIFGIKSALFQAVAHLYVGGLFAVYFKTWERFYLYLALGLTLLEVVCFLLLK